MLTNIMKPLPGFLSENRSKDIYGWKRVYYFNGKCGGNYSCSYEPAIAKLIIPKDAIVVFTNHKCRASYVIVDGFYPDDRLFEPGPSKKMDIKLAVSAYDVDFWYEDGKIATPDSFNPDPDIECSHGIHFFRTYVEARQYVI